MFFIRKVLLVFVFLSSCQGISVKASTFFKLGEKMRYLAVPVFLGLAGYSYYDLQKAKQNNKAIFEKNNNCKKFNSTVTDGSKEPQKNVSNWNKSLDNIIKK